MEPFQTRQRNDYRYWFVSKSITVITSNCPLKHARRANYKWLVSLVVDTERRSKDIMAGGAIERVASPAALSAKLPSDDKRKAAYAYAESGIWYDAIATLSDLVEAAPQDKALHQQRASLLEQAGLAEIAEYDLRAVKAE